MLRNRFLLLMLAMSCILFSCSKEDDPAPPQDFTTSEDSFILTCEGKSIYLKVNISSGRYWVASSTKEWISFANGSDNQHKDGESVLFILIPSNTTNVERKGEIIFTVDKKEIKRISITQKSTATIEVSGLKEVYETDRGDYQLEIYAPFDWTLQKTSDPDEGIITLFDDTLGKANINKIITFRTTVEDSEIRPATLKISNTEGKLEPLELEIKFIPYKVELSNKNIKLSVFEEENKIDVISDAQFLSNISIMWSKPDGFMPWLYLDFSGANKNIKLTPRANLTGEVRETVFEFYGMEISVEQEARKVIKSNDHYIEIYPKNIYPATPTWYDITNPEHTLSCEHLDKYDLLGDRNKLGTGWRLPTHKELISIYQQLILPSNHEKPSGFPIKNQKGEYIRYVSSVSVAQTSFVAVSMRPAFGADNYPDWDAVRKNIQLPSSEYATRAVRTVPAPKE